MTTIHVSKNDPSAFSTLQEAILSIDDRHDEAIRIEVAPGIYEEKLFIRKENIEIVGDDPLTTVFRYGDGAKKPRPDASGEYGTFNTAVIFIAGKDITLRNLTIESTAGPGYLAGQALAVYAAADRLSCYNCRFTGWQDTIFNGDPMTCNMKKLMLPDFFQASEVPIVHKFYRNYFKDCYVCGDVDYIFGPNRQSQRGKSIYHRRQHSRRTGIRSCILALSDHRRGAGLRLSRSSLERLREDSVYLL